MIVSAPARSSVLPRIGFGVDYDVCRWSLDGRDDVARMREAGVTMVSLGGVSWNLLQPSLERFTFGWLRDILDHLHENGIAVDLATATASPPAWLAALHPETLAVNREGRAVWPGDMRYRRLSSPVFRRYALALVERMAVELGDHPALATWRVTSVSGPSDHSDDAAAAFRTWLRTRYATVSQLNEAWHPVLPYDGFEQVHPPQGADWNPEQELDFSRYSSWALDDYVRAEVGMLRRMSSVRVTASMRVLGGPGLDHAGLGNHVDIVSHDHYADVVRSDSWLGLSFSASAARGVSFGGQWMSRARARAGEGEQLATPPGQLARDRFTQIAHGADAVLSSRWETSGEGWREFVALGTALAAVAELAGTSVEPAPVAILLDGESWDASDAALRWYSEFVRQGIAADVLPLSAPTEGYALVVSPHATTGLGQHIAQLLHSHGVRASQPRGVEARQRRGAEHSYWILVNHGESDVRPDLAGEILVTARGAEIINSNSERMLPAGGVMVVASALS